MIPAHTTRTLLAMLEQLKPATRFVLNTFFGGPPTLSDSKYVDIDIYRGVRRMAPFVNPVLEGKLVERLGYTTETFSPPYLKPKLVYKPGDMYTREPGEAVQVDGQRPSGRFNMRLARDMTDSMDQISRREEWMACQALVTGQVPVVGDGVDATIDFLMPADHKVTLSGADLWTDPASDPIADIRVWRRKIAQDSGLSADVIIMGSDVADAFIANAEVARQLDTRRADLGQIAVRDIPDGVTFVGSLFSGAVDIYAYEGGWYVDDLDGTEKTLIPADRLIVGATSARAELHYGAIEDFEAGPDGLAAMSRFPKQWVEKDPSTWNVLIQSAPLPVPHQIDAFMTVQAV